MLSKFVFFVILAVLLILESTLISYPFVFILTFLLFLRYRAVWTLIAAFIVSFVLDSIRVIPIGTTAMVLFALFFVLIAYTRSLHIGGVVIILIACFGATILYSIVAHYPINLIFHALVFAALSVIAYRMQSRQEEPQSLFGPQSIN